MKRLGIVALLGAACAAVPALAADKTDVARATEILGRSVAFATVEGRGQVPAYAAYLAGELKAAGYADGDISIEPLGETAALIATYRGTAKKKPIVLNAHMDVVAAKREDWEREPFKMIADGPYLFGRGIADNKFDLSVIVATLIRLKREGFKPSRDIVLVLTGDEESAQKTTAALAPRFKGAELVLNGDGGGGTLGEDGKPMYYSLQAAEKTYADYKVTVTDPGGHSSRPTGSNAIVALSAAVGRVAAYQFPAEASDLTRAFFRETAKRTPGELGQAMARFAADPTDAAAIAALSAESEYIGNVRTTCVATMIEGGHAPNALPQRATANINCRIFPGNSPESIRVKLQELVGDKAAVTLPEEFPASNISPLRADVMAALRKAIDTRAKGLAIVPGMSAGTTDSVFFRGQGIPSYGVSGLFMKPSDDFSHGLNERVPAASIGPALDHYHTLLTELAK